MTLMINNLTATALSLDIYIDARRGSIRETLPIGGSVDVSDRLTLDELENNPTVKALRGISPVGTPKISISGTYGLYFPDDGAGLVFPAAFAIASSTTGMTSGTAAGVVRVQIGTTTRYINLYSGAPST